MTGLTMNWPIFSFGSLKAKETPKAVFEPQSDNQHQDLRRAYATEMLASGACVGEFGAQALMAVFPKDF